MKKEITTPVHKALDTAQETVQKVEKRVELYLQRFISNVQYLNDHPLAMLSIGLVVLALTGTLYKKLG